MHVFNVCMFLKWDRHCHCPPTFFSPQHIPSSVPLQTLLPLLALCQYRLDLEVERELQTAPAGAHTSSQLSCIAQITHHVTGSMGVERAWEGRGLIRQCGQLAAITANCYRLVFVIMHMLVCVCAAPWDCCVNVK